MERIGAVLLAWLTVTTASSVLAADPGPLLARLKAVGHEGSGNVEASKAWRELVALGPDTLPDTLMALDDASPAAINWLRSAIDAIAEREVTAGRSLPATQLEAFVKDTRHKGLTRRVAYEWLCKVDAKAPDRLLPGMLNDPGSQLRRDAVARVLEEARKLRTSDKAAAAVAYQKLLASARDRDQVDAIAKELKELGVSIDLRPHYGFISRWQLLGPFDNTGGAGFSKALPPEQRIDLSAVYDGKKEAKLRWTEHETADPYGMVDLNKTLGKNMGAVAYALAVVNAPAERKVELRAGSNNAVKIFLNGKQVFFREEYHHGMRMDQHIGVATLKPGRNEVLVKICQNEQTEPWAQLWSFQLRICDDLGGGVPVTVLAAKPTQGEKVQP